jgi:hypothetical protein
MLLWMLLWFVLLVGAGVGLGLLARTLWRKLRALTTELGVASERLTAVLASLNALTDDQQPTTAPGRSYDRET